MDIFAHFRFPGFFERRKTPRLAERSEQTNDEERPSFVEMIPIVVPLAAVVLAALVYGIFWASWSY